MAGPKRVPLPAVLTGNDLLGGDVVYYSGSGFTRDFAQARLAVDDEGAEQLVQKLSEIEAGGHLVLPYLMKARVDENGRAMPDHYRDRIRLGGPTVAAGRTPEGPNNVSL